MPRLPDTQSLNFIADEINPTRFFHEQVVAAQEKNNLKLTENVEFYLVQLLCNFVSSKKAENNEHEDCLALLFKKALESPHEERVVLFKELADTSLYFSGFFQDYFNNKAFNIRYYISMGESAYSELSQLMRGGHATYNSTMAQIYKEMSLHYLKAMDVLLSVSEQTTHNEYERSSLSLYDAWINTNSKKLEKDLIGRGIIPVFVNSQKPH